MSWIAVGVGAGSLVAGVAGSAISSNAASNAANTQAAAANNANSLQNQIYQQQLANQQPYLQAGTAALSQMQDPYFQQNFTAADMQSEDPGYDFRMQQGQQALERSAAAKGGLQSGGTLKALTQYSQDYASNEFNNAYNRFTNTQNDRFGRLATIAGMGQGATNQAGAYGTNYANQSGQNTMDSANAQGAAGIASANSWGNTLSSLGRSGMDAVAINQIGNQTGNWMSRYLNSRGTPMAGESYGSLSNLA